MTNSSVASSDVPAFHLDLALLEKYAGDDISTNDASEYRSCLASAAQALEQLFDEGASARTLVGVRSDYIDTLLAHLWARSVLGTSAHALIAVGGYGRRELHPHSDIDLAILLRGKLSKPERAAVESLITFLWDIGLEVGHSVRNLKESVAAARDDLTIMTNLLEGRIVVGDSALLDALLAKTSGQKIWPSQAFFTAKLAEQADRHAKYEDAFQELEPNIKESPGGLRDVQVATWVTKRHFNTTGLRGLVDNGFISAEEGDALLRGEEFLWLIRCAMHFIAGRREDRLLFDHQKSVAVRLGYVDDGSNRAVEVFMKDYYRTVREIASVNELLLGLFQEAIVEADKKEQIEPLNRRFQICNSALEITRPDVFSRSPTALLEIFLLLQQHPEITGIRAATIRELRRNLHRIGGSFRKDLRARSLFMEIIRQPRRIGHELQRMHRHGVLSAYLPVFAAVEGLMQFDLFHIYTVDVHALAVVRHMRYFSFPRSEDDQSSVVRETVEQIPKLENLYLAGLFHDIAKGRGGDHSQLGAEDAVEFCQMHDLSKFDTHLIAWLVRHHLIMSMTAQTKDIHDIEVVKEFAKVVGDKTHLDYLFLLTIADIRGTNPALWTSWKEALLCELYVATRRLLHRGDNVPLDKDDQIRSTREAANELLIRANFTSVEVAALWNTLGDNYFLRHRPEEIAWHTTAILSAGPDELPVVSVQSFTERGGTGVFVYEKDVDNLFAVTTAALGKLRLDVLDARIITSNAGFTLDTFMVVEAVNGDLIEDPTRIKKIQGRISDAIRSGEVAPKLASSVANRKVKHFSFPAQVEFSFDKVHNCTVMEVMASDQPGLLSKIGFALQQCDVSLHDARIATFGAHVEDFFYVTDRNNRRLDSEIAIPRLRKAVLEALAT